MNKKTNGAREKLFMKISSKFGVTKIGYVEEGLTTYTKIVHLLQE